jgi:RNA-binding protein Musashi
MSLLSGGKVDACTIMRDPSGTSRGFAFMTFEDENSVKGVLGKEHVLDGKTVSPLPLAWVIYSSIYDFLQIDPKRAIPREEHMRNTRFFVGGLSPNTTSESMKEFFSAYGKVVDATVMMDRDTGRSKGFGFVTYEDALNTDQLVGKIGLILDDKQVKSTSPLEMLTCIIKYLSD